MKRVCAWCNKFMGNVEQADVAVGLTTHSICDECADNLDFQLGVSLRRYLESLKIPICLVNDDEGVLLANSAARACSGALSLQPDGEWEGKIYECSQARLPERCSHIIHCSGCTIRFAATETCATGREFVSVPSLVNGCTSSPDQKFDYLISTKLVNGIVHLKIKRI